MTSIPAAALKARTRLTEKAFMAQVVQLAKLTGWLVYHTHDSRRSVAGFPDLFLLRRERVVCAELKVGNAKPTTAQLQWLTAMNRAGIPAFVWTPDSWPTIESVLT